MVLLVGFLFLRGLFGFAEGSLLRRTLSSLFANGLSAAIRNAFVLRLDVGVESGLLLLRCF